MPVKRHWLRLVKATVKPQNPGPMSIRFPPIRLGADTTGPDLQGQREE
jgi:hypothetical protein